MSSKNGSLGGKIYTGKSSRIWLALLLSVLIHGAAVALAEIHRQPLPVPPAIGEPETTIDFVPSSPQVEPPPPSEDPEVEAPPVAQPQNDFPELASPPPRQSRKLAAPPIPHPPVVRSGPSITGARALAFRAPRPEYPYEARRSRITGEGVALLTIDPSSGRVVDATMVKSTGSAVLDQASIAGFRRWRFKIGTQTTVRCPITFTLTGAQF